jgi:hypothetical protein
VAPQPVDQGDRSAGIESLAISTSRSIATGAKPTDAGHR